MAHLPRRSAGPSRHRRAGRRGRCVLTSPLAAVPGVDQQQRSQGQQQKAETGHRQVGHFAAVPGRLVQTAKHRRGDQPGQHQGRAGNHRIAPRQFAVPARGHVQHDAGQKTDRHQNDRDHHHPAVDPIEPFQAGQPQPARRPAACASAAPPAPDRARRRQSRSSPSRCPAAERCREWHPQSCEAGCGRSAGDRQTAPPRRSAAAPAAAPPGRSRRADGKPSDKDRRPPAARPPAGTSQNCSTADWRSPRPSDSPDSTSRPRNRRRPAPAPPSAAPPSAKTAARPRAARRRYTPGRSRLASGRHQA